MPVLLVLEEHLPAVAFDNVHDAVVVRVPVIVIRRRPLPHL